jgi:hypothetical protein
MLDKTNFTKRDQRNNKRRHLSQCCYCSVSTAEREQQALVSVSTEKTRFVNSQRDDKHRIIIIIIIASSNRGIRGLWRRVVAALRCARRPTAAEHSMSTAGADGSKCCVRICRSTGCLESNAKESIRRKILRSDWITGDDDAFDITTTSNTPQSTSQQSTIGSI